jgi:hypothetical protein
MPTRPSGPSAPWFDEDGEIEYVGDEVLFAEALEGVAQELAEHLEARASNLRHAPTVQSIEEEVRMQMATAAARGDFNTVQQLRDMLLSVYMARENTKRAV